MKYAPPVPKKLQKIILFGFISVGLVTVWLMWSVSNRDDWTQYKLIAHAAGGIDGKAYTNSREALQKSYANGYRLIEIDFILGKDNKVVARHDWTDSYGQKAFIAAGQPLTRANFMSSKYYDKYASLDLSSVIKLMSELPDIYVIVDAKTMSVDDTIAIYKEISKELEGVDESIISRLIAQIFYKADLEIVRSHGFSNILYVPGREGYDIDHIIRFSKENSIKAVSLPYRRAVSKDLKKLNDNGIKPYLYTLNDLHEMKQLQSIGAYGFFADFVSPHEIK